LNTEKIITHNGYAHFDEFLAISLILARHEDTHFFIERREPTETELDDSGIWVIDIGDRYEPGRKNFDHHQDLNLPASFVLVTEYLELKEALSHFPWWDFKDSIDRRGGYKMAKELGINSVDPLVSPVENFFIDLFAENPISMYEQMRMFGKKLIGSGYRLKEQISFWENCQQLYIKNKRIIIGYTDETNGSVQFCESMPDPPVVRINYDGRGDGWSLATILDAEGVDFSRLQGHDQIKFAHKNGFIAKTKSRIPLKEVLNLVEMAIY
jgi:hypothetical protein